MTGEHDESTQIDWVKAAILERKMALKLSWQEIAASAHCNHDFLRKLVSTKHTDAWNPEIRTAVCKTLGISVKKVIGNVKEGELFTE